MDDYGQLVRALNEIDTTRRTETSAATNAYTAALSTASAEVTHAEHVVRQAEASLAAAAAHVDAVDERAGALWSELSALSGRRLGSLPMPACDLASGVDSPDELLDRASMTIARSALGEPIAPIPRSLIPLLPPAGAIAALAVGLPIRGILALTGHRVTGVYLVAEILIFFAPFAGVPLLIAWTRHHYGARPDIGAAALTTLGGMIASCALVLFFR